MAVIYYKRIKAGRMTLDDVPHHWYEAVKKMLEEDSNE